MARKRQFQTFKEAKKRGFFDEYPMVPAGVDPQIHMSRSQGRQPFFLICEKDTVIAQLSGEARVELKDSPVLYDDLQMGDFLYIPAGTPARITATTESIHYRYKADNAGLEGLAWYCESCGSEVLREVWDTAEEVPQAAYLRITGAFNASREMRTCGGCGEVHATVDTSGNNWEKIAAELAEGSPGETSGD